MAKNPPRPIGPESHDGFLGNPMIAKMTGASPWIRQFDIVTLAKTKAAAAAQYKAVGIAHFTTARLRILTGHAIDKLIEVELLVDDGAVLVWHNALEGHPIVRVAPEEAARVVAHWGPTTWPTDHRSVVKVTS